MNSSPYALPRSDVGSAVTPLLRAVLLADLVDSTGFVQRFGDARAAVALQRLDLQIRDLLEFTGGRLIDKADGLLALFERPVQAVDFALRYQQALRHFSSSEGVQLTARVGIHVGEVMTWSNTPEAVAQGAKPLEVEGLAKPVAARLMALALPGQTLISSMAQTLAQRAQSELGERGERVRWISHGRYRFKGVPAPLIVHEVGETGFAPLKQPPSGLKSWREVPPWRRPQVLAVELLVFLAIGGFYAYGLLRSPPALAFDERDWVVVGDVSNFTADPRLEDSLETALRITLDQSRFLNVVPKLKVQEVLHRMGRSEQTTVDRAVASEIALREGARAVLLPSVAEVGGRVRVSMELVDPNTQATVFAQTADGDGAASALASLDTLSIALRERLGESMRKITATGKPLALVTTGNLDALRFFSMAMDAMRESHYDEALRLLNLAIEQDPKFAMAYANRGLLQANGNGDNAAAKRDYLMAASLKGRMTVRESLLLDANIASSGPPGPLIDRLDLLTRLYPESFGSRRRAAQVNWAFVQDFPRAQATLAPALKQQNPTLSSAMYLSGLLNLAQEKYQQAGLDFSKFESVESRGFNRDNADLYAVSRQYAKARRVLHHARSTGLGPTDLLMRLPEVTYPLDQGLWSQALAALLALQNDAAGVPLATRVYAGTLLALRSYENRAATLPDWQRFVAAEMKNANDPAEPDLFHVRFAALYGAGQLARSGDLSGARRVAETLRAAVGQAGFPTLIDMAAVLDAEIALAAGDPNSAVDALSPQVDGTELCLVHSALLRAYQKSRRVPEARLEAAWISAHRGRAYTEWNSEYLLQPVNVLETDLALLTGAELAQSAGDERQATVLLERFSAAWAQPPGFAAERVQALARSISSNRNRTSPAGASK